MKITMKFYNEISDEVCNFWNIQPIDISRQHVKEKINRKYFGFCEHCYQLAINHNIGMCGYWIGSGKISLTFNYISIYDMIDIFKTFKKTKNITKHSADSHYIRQLVEHPQKYEGYVGHGDVQLAAILAGFNTKHFVNAERVLSFNMSKKDIDSYFRITNNENFF